MSAGALQGSLMLDRLIDVSIIPWEPGCLGIALTFASGHVTKFAVGNLKEANDELERLATRLR
jgi:hypothetical protein